jgi:N-acetylmuramic acid 6-phosphate etherase
MARLGKVHGNLMVDVDTSKNAKLVERGARILTALTGAPREEALELLGRAGGQVKVAALMRLRALDADAARAKLAQHQGHLRRALEA